jgi:hypothetical protein
LLDAPGGELLLAVAGIAVVCTGLFQIRYGWKEEFLKRLSGLGSHADLVTTAGKWGYIARGIVFAVIGAFIVVAALQHDASQVTGTEGALDALARLPWLLALVAIGLICYGLFCFVQAKYRHVNM